MPRGVRQETRDGERRSKRRPLGETRLKLEATIPKHLVGRWVNDTPGRIQDALDAGYSFISDEGVAISDRAGARSARVGVNADGSGMTAYLMAIPRVLYDEDQAVKQARVDELDDAIKRGNIRGADEKDTKSYYVPPGGISVRTD